MSQKPVGGDILAVKPFVNCYILDATTAFAAANANSSLSDSGSPVDPNDIAQGGLGDCYFVAAMEAVAKCDPGVVESLLALTGELQSATMIDATMTNQDIAGIIQGCAAGGTALIGTSPPAPGEPSIILPSGGILYFDHAYLLQQVKYANGAITGVELINPWGNDPDQNDYDIVVPIDDFTSCFGAVYGFMMP